MNPKIENRISLEELINSKNTVLFINKFVNAHKFVSAFEEKATKLAKIDNVSKKNI